MMNTIISLVTICCKDITGFIKTESPGNPQRSKFSGVEVKT